MNAIDGPPGASVSVSFSSASDSLVVSPIGPWTIEQCDALEARMTELTSQVLSAPKVIDSMTQVAELDTAGAWLLERLARNCIDRNVEVDFRDLPDRYQGLFDQMRRVNRASAE